MRITTLLSAATFLASVCTAFADAPTISELIELSGVATGPSEYNEEGYRQLAALIQAANIPTPTAPEVRSEDIILERMTNGERLAKGLPLKAPIRRRSRSSLNRLNPRVIPQAIASPAPRQTVTGFLGFKDAAGQKVGYVRNTMVNNAQAAFTISQSQAVKVSITFDSSESLPLRLRVSLLNPPPVAGFSLLALIQGRDNLDQDLSPGTFEYVYLGGGVLPGSGPGSTGVSGQNTYTAATGVGRISQTDVWTFDQDSSRVFPSWVNTDGSVQTFAFYTQGNAVYGLMNAVAFAAKYPSPIKGPYFLYIEPESVVY